MVKIAFAPIYRYEVPPGHRFPMEKYTLLPEQLLYEGTVEEKQFFAPGRLSEEHLLLTHEPAYWNKLKNQTLSRREVRAIGFPMRPELIERGRHIARGTIDCALHARDHGLSLNIAGGTHHSFTYKGEGFCVLNDIAIAANYLLHRGLARRILIIDLDVHQGNGTAQIFRNESRVFTFSMHGARNYPLRKEVSDLDIPLPDKTGDKAYLDTLERTLPHLLDRFEPDMAFYLSGVDVLESDRLGRLSLSPEGCRKRDRFVMACCKNNQLPLAVSMGGGYSERLAQIIEAHANTFRVGMDLFG